MKTEFELITESPEEGFQMEGLIGRTLPAYMRRRLLEDSSPLCLTAFEKTSKALDRRGVDFTVSIENCLKGSVCTLNVDITLTAGHKAVHVWDNKKHHVQAGTVLTHAVWDWDMLSRYRSGLLDTKGLLREGIKTWERIKGFCIREDYKGLLEYAHANGY